MTINKIRIFSFKLEMVIGSQKIFLKLYNKVRYKNIGSLNFKKQKMSIQDLSVSFDGATKIPIFGFKLKMIIVT